MSSYLGSLPGSMSLQDLFGQKGRMAGGAPPFQTIGGGQMPPVPGAGGAPPLRPPDWNPMPVTGTGGGDVTGGPMPPTTQGGGRFGGPMPPTVQPPGGTGGPLPPTPAPPGGGVGAIGRAGGGMPPVPTGAGGRQPPPVWHPPAGVVDFGYGFGNAGNGFQFATPQHVGAFRPPHGGGAPPVGFGRNFGPPSPFSQGPRLQSIGSPRPGKY